MTPLGKESATRIVVLLAKVYKRWTPSQELADIERDRISGFHISEEQARVIVAASLDDAKGATPDLAKLHLRMRLAAQQNAIMDEASTRVEKRVEQRTEAVRIRYPKEWCSVHRATNDDYYRSLSAFQKDLCDFWADSWDRTHDRFIDDGGIVRTMVQPEDADPNVMRTKINRTFGKGGRASRGQVEAMGGKR